MSDSSSSGPSPQGGASKRASLAIHMRMQPQPFEYVDTWFHVELGLNVPQSFTARADAALHLHASLHVHTPAGPSSEPVSISAAQLLTDPHDVIQIPFGKGPDGNRRVKVRCKIRTEPKIHASSQYCIKFAVLTEQLYMFDTIEPIFTIPLRVVSTKIQIETTDWEEIWYKDEGGRDKCMQVVASLRDSAGAPVYKRRIPLKLTLLYDNEQSLKVMRQETLRVLGPPKQFIDPDTGMATLQFRIEDVSKNHQGQNFKVQVSPDLSKAADVAPACTPSVSVRSKRNKRRQGSQVSTMTPHSGLRSASPTPAMGPQISSMRSPHAFQASGVSDQQKYAFTGVTDVKRLRDAMTGVINWTKEVVNGLYPLKWQIIGYAQAPGGPVDYNRPYHSMPNPNACISRVLSMYSEETLEHLHVLSDAVNNTSQGRGTDESGTVSGLSYQGQMQAYPVGLPQGASPYGTDDPSRSQMAQMPIQAAGPNAFSTPSSAGSDPFTSLKKPRIEGTSLYAELGGNLPRAGVPQTIIPHHSPYSSHTTNQSIVTAQNVGMRIDDMNPLQTFPHQATLEGVKHPPISEVDTQHDSRTEDDIEGETRKAEVEYVLAKQFKSLRTGEKLGFPAFNAAKEILGFYNDRMGADRFVPITRHRDEFGPREMADATRVLDDAMSKNSQAVFTRKEWGGTLPAMVDHALVYDWSKDIGNNNSSSSEGTDTVGVNRSPQQGISWDAPHHQRD